MHASRVESDTGQAAVDPSTYCTIDAQSLLICSSGITLEVDKRTGEWRQVILRLGDRRIVPQGSSRLPFDLHCDGRWLSADTMPEVIQWDQRTEMGRFALRLEVTFGSFLVRERICMDPDGMGIQRSLDIRYRGSERGILRAVDLSLPAIRLDEHNPGTLILPNHSGRHSVSMEELGRMGATRERVDGDYRAGVVAPGGIETFPDNWSGVVGIHHEVRRTGLLTYLSPSAAPVLFSFHVQDNGIAVSACQRLEMFVEPGGEFATATQHLRFYHSSWADALEGYQRQFRVWGIRPVEATTPWIAGKTLYETSMDQWGGVEGLIRALPDLRDLGIDALNLLPVWASSDVTREMKTNRRLDRNWQDHRLPDHITDFESLDSGVGSPDSLRRLVDEAHSLGLKVLIDFVFHGVSEPSWLLQRRPHWLVRDDRGNAHASHGWEPGFSLDWANPEVEDYLVDFGTKQVRLFDLDGLRAINPFWKESNWGCGAGRQPYQTNLAGLNILKRLREEMARIRPDAVVISESRGPAFVGISDALSLPNVLLSLAGLGRGEITARELHEYLRDVRLCYPAGTLLHYALESHRSTLWEKSPSGLRGAAIVRPLFAVAALAGDLVSICGGQERGQEGFVRELLSVRRSRDTLTTGLVLHRGIRCDGRNQMAFMRHLGPAIAIVVANFDSVWSRTTVQVEGDLLSYFERGRAGYQRLYPAESVREEIDLSRLGAWEVELPPFSVVIDHFEA